MKQQVIIVGAGASGLAAAIQAARQGASVTVLEHTARPGKKTSFHWKRKMQFNQFNDP